MKRTSFYPKSAGKLTEEERIAICAALYPEQANKAPENRALWPKNRPLTAQEKMAWSRYVRRPPATRYDIYPAFGWKYGKVYRPTDPILWALRMRRAGLARRLLEEKGALDWVDASRYAPWTLRWSPSLLKLILDLAPAGEPLGCCHRFTRTGGDWKICVNATLLTAAAALDDIASVELLLQYGYDAAPEPDQYGDVLPRDMRHRYHAHRDYDGDDPDRHYMHSTLPLDISDISMEHTLFLIPTDEGAKKGITRPHARGQWERSCQPLSAALSCGATRCALRLLEYSKAVDSRHVQTTVSYLADFGISPFRETLDAVMDALGTTPERFVEPMRWEEKNSERFLKCLQYHDFYSLDWNGERYDCAVLILDHLYTEWGQKASAMIPPERLSQALPKYIHTMGRSTYFPGKERLTELQARLGITLTLERDAVLPGTCWYALLYMLDYVAVGPPPADHLSALAIFLLNTMLLERPLRGEWYPPLGEKPGLDPMYEILHNSKAMRLLAHEDKDLVYQALEKFREEHPDSNLEAIHLSMILLKHSLFFRSERDG